MDDIPRRSCASLTSNVDAHADPSRNDQRPPLKIVLGFALVGLVLFAAVVVVVVVLAPNQAAEIIAAIGSAFLAIMWAWAKLTPQILS